jgi:hypothetical protein
MQVESEIDVNTILSNNRTSFGLGVDELYANTWPEIAGEANPQSITVG